MKYLNLIKNNKMIVVFILVILLSTIVITSSSFSKSELILKSTYILEGDTLWSIAEYELKHNPYFKGKDIREVISEIKKINGIKSANLQIGQEIFVPEI